MDKEEEILPQDIALQRILFGIFDSQTSSTIRCYQHRYLKKTLGINTIEKLLKLYGYEKVKTSLWKKK